MAIAITVTAANDSLDSAADNDLLESKTNNKGQPFYVRNSSMIRGHAIEFLSMHSQFNGMPLGKLTIACCSVHSNGRGAGSDRL